MLSSVTLDCQLTKTVMNSGSQLSELCLKSHKSLGLSELSEMVKVVKNCQSCPKLSKLSELSKFSEIVKVVRNCQTSLFCLLVFLLMILIGRWLMVAWFAKVKTLKQMKTLLQSLLSFTSEFSFNTVDN